MTRRTSSIVTIAASLLFGSAGIAAAQYQPGQTPPARPGDTNPPAARMGAPAAGAQDISDQLRSFAQDPRTACDKIFVLHAGMGHLMEIELAKQAVQKATNPEVKQAAQHILDDHQKALQQLRPVAQALNVQLPSSLSPEKQQMIQILTSLPTDQFEKHYILAMQADHAADLVKYRGVAQLSQNEQVKQYAQQQIPVLAQHAEQVQQAAVALGLPTAGEAVPAAGRIEGTTPSGRTGTGTGGDTVTPDQRKTGGTGGGIGGSPGGNDREPSR
jgi:putative membrane protein